MPNIGPFLGINNLLPANSLTVPKKGQYLRHSFNVDVQNDGWLKRRQGFSRSMFGSFGHSLWSNRTRTLYVSGTILREITSFSPFASAPIYTLLSSSPMDYVDVAGDIYFSNGTDSGKLLAASSSAQPWRLPSPPMVAISVIAGSLQPADYLLCISFAASTQEEGGASTYQRIALGSSGGFQLSLPAAPSGAAFINIFISGPDGDIPLWHSQVAAGTTTATITTPSNGYSVPFPRLMPQPAGQIVEQFNGRLLVASGRLLTYSEPYNLGLHQFSRDYIPFPQDVTNVVATKGGVFVTADKTYWHAGPDIAESTQSILKPYGASSRSRFHVAATKQVGWYGDNGVVLGDETGEISVLQESALAVDTAASAATLMREVDGVSSVIVCLQGTPQTPALASPQVAIEEGQLLSGL